MFILHVSKALNCVIPRGVRVPGPFMEPEGAEDARRDTPAFALHFNSGGVGDRGSPSLKKKKNSKKKKPKPNPPQSKYKCI